MSQSESYEYLIFWITGSFLNRCLGTLDCSRALLTRNSRGPSRTVLDFDLKGEIPMFCLVLWLVPLLSISPSRTVDSVRDTPCTEIHRSFRKSLLSPLYLSQKISNHNTLEHATLLHGM